MDGVRVDGIKQMGKRKDPINNYGSSFCYRNISFIINNYEFIHVGTELLEEKSSLDAYVIALYWAVTTATSTG